MPVNFEKTKKKDSKPKEESQDKESKEGIMQRINTFLLKFSRVPLKEKLFFVQHLGIMLKAGISLSTGIETLSQQTSNKYFITILKDISQQVEKGISFADSLKPYEKIFGELFVRMIEAGELSGKLEEVLAQLYVQMKKEHTLIAKIKGALTYPAVVIVAMIGISTFMIVVVVPKITAIFDEMDVELPLPTKILIGLSNAIVNNGLLSALLVILFIVLIFRILKTQKGKSISQGLLLKMPIFGSIIKKINLARFSRNISALLKTDILIIKTFQITANVLGNLHYRKAIKEMGEQLRKGESISDSIKKYPKLFPPVVTQMVAVGEETGELDTILSELAEFYEEEVNQIMENLPAIIEPLLILILGVGVGGIAVAIIMPMYAIGNAI